MTAKSRIVFSLVPASRNLRVFASWILLFLFFIGHSVDADETPPKQSSQSLTLIVDFSDGAEKRLKGIPWKKGITVLDVMLYSHKHPHGAKFERKGKGATAFLSKIDDMKNQGSRGRNWIFKVNGKTGERSFGIHQLNPGDTILWKFDTYP